MHTHVPRPMSRGLLGFEIAAVICLFVLEPFFVALASLFATEWGEPSVAYDQTWLVARSFAVCVPVLYIMRRSGRAWEHFGITRPAFMDLWLGFLMYVSYVVWMYVFWYGVYFVFGSDPVEGAAELADSHRGHAYSSGEVFLILLGSLATGAMEELAARAYLIPRLTEWLRSQALAIVVAALIFASFHIYQGAWNTVAILGMGLIYGVAFVLLRRVWPLALGHALTNAILYLSE